MTRKSFRIWQGYPDNNMFMQFRDYFGKVLGRCREKVRLKEGLDCDSRVLRHALLQPGLGEHTVQFRGTGTSTVRHPHALHPCQKSWSMSPHPTC